MKEVSPWAMSLRFDGDEERGSNDEGRVSVGSSLDPQLEQPRNHYVQSERGNE